MALAFRGDFDAARLRLCARHSGDADQVRRLLGLAVIYDGASRAEAAGMLHHAVVVHIEGSSYRMRQHADLLPPASPPGPHPGAQPKRRGRPPKVAADTVAVL